MACVMAVRAALAFVLLAVAHVMVAASEPAAELPGGRAPDDVVAELESTLGYALDRFHRMDAEGVLAHVSERYRTGPLTKPAVRQQLLAVFAAHETIRARVRIDEVRMIDGRAWVYSTGDVSGRLRLLGTPVVLWSWKLAPEVAWREDGRWRLIGDQQP
jgi:hypothetical protein